MPERMTSVYDIPDFLAERFPTLTAPVRAAWNAGRLPIDIGADALRRGVHGALGLEEEAPWGYTGQTMSNLVGALGDMPQRQAVRIGAEAATSAGERLRDALIASGARPQPEPVRPLRLGPGYLDAELRAGAPSTPVAQTPSRRRAPYPGALPPPVPAEIPAEGAGNDVQGALAEPAVGAPPAAPAPRLALDELYRSRVAAIPREGESQLTDQQKKHAKIDLFLRMLANNRPGSRFLQNLGAAGSSVSNDVRRVLEQNRREAGERRREGREDAFRELGFADKEEDNRARSRQLDITEKQGNERLALLKKQVDQGKWKVMDNGKSGTYVLFDQETGQTRDTGIKVYREPRDTRPPQVRLIEYLEGLESEKRARAFAYLQGGKDKNDSDQIFDKAIEMVRTGAAANPRDAVRLAREAMAEARGGTSAAPRTPGAISRTDPMYQEALKDPRIGGDRKKLDEMLQQRGLTIVDRLPAGLPAGSKQIGTHKGKSVYEAPDGKRYVVE